MTNPREKITRITSSYPADPRSPFYDVSGTDMKPLARVVITRQRVYEKACTDTSPITEDTIGHPDNSGDALRRKPKFLFKKKIKWFRNIFLIQFHLKFNSRMRCH